jgi:carboxypeptidase C (cathepsin A)
MIDRRTLLAQTLALSALAPRWSMAQQAAAPLDYAASAAFLNVGQDPERPDIEMFHVDYILNGTDPATRAVTFLVNGGPGAATIFLHIAAIGPKTVATAGDGSFPPVPAHLQDNPDTWLPFTDLVFIDSVGTGYSRMLPLPDGSAGDPTPYWAVDADMHSIAWFIRQWLTVNGRWSSPKSLVGESYGGMRVAGLSRILAENYGINLNRAVLISPAMHTEIPDTRYSILGPVTRFPSMVAIAAFQGRSTAGTGVEALPAIEEFALNDLTTGLINLGRMSEEEQDAFYDTVAGMMGLDRDLVERKRARFTDQEFAVALLADEGRIIDRYDGTQTSDNPFPELSELGTLDRSLAVLTGVLLPPFMDYVRNDLGFVTDRDYIPLNMAVNMHWDRNSPTGGPEDLATALTQNEDLHALIVHGMHDLSTPYFLSRYAIEQSTVSDSARERLNFGVYPGGHMFYLQTASATSLLDDVRAFYDGTA